MRDPASLILRQGFFDDPVARASYAMLMRDVFDVDVAFRQAFSGDDLTCRAFGLFDPSGPCVASAEVFALPLVLDASGVQAVGIRSVAVAETWRGRGLFRTVMQAALAWCDGAGVTLSLLYTEESSLYERFGFRDVPQHKVSGPGPAGGPGAARRLDLTDRADLALIRRQLARRAPVSDHVAVNGAAGLFLTQIAADDSLALHHAPTLDAIIVSREIAGRLSLVDVVAPAIPPLSALLTAFDRRIDQAEVLFPPDKLGWTGAVVRDDTGLMARGAWPAAFDRPFMLPPTAEF